MAQFMENAGALHLGRRAAARAEIVMGYHVLEKGLTMPRRRLGFGKGAVLRLMDLVDSFERRFGEDPQVAHAVGVLRAYRELHREWPEPMTRLDAFLAARSGVPAAVEPHVARSDFFAAKDAPFPAFAASRHCVRHFAGPVPRETIERAIAVAATAPSACNRQHARVHVVDSPALRDRILALQGGTRGFGADVDKLLVVTADLSAVRWAWERHDAFTNGGIFALNLCYALHHEGVANCILHWSVPPKADAAARTLLGIPAQEEIVLSIACGTPPDEFDVPASPRRDPASITTWHGDPT
jgi:nitroreductase